MDKKEFEEFEVECGKCHKNFKVKLKDPTTVKKYTFICGKCAKMLSLTRGKDGESFNE